MPRILHHVLFLTGLLYLLWVPAAHAYLDPGSGSYFTQLLLAGMAGGAYVVKLYYGQIKGFVQSALKGKKKEQEQPEKRDETSR